MSAAGSPIRVSDDLLALFRRASRDENPIHHSAEVARRTLWGRPIGFGIMGALQLLAALPPRPDRMLAPESPPSDLD